MYLAVEGARSPSSFYGTARPNRLHACTTAAISVTRVAAGCKAMPQPAACSTLCSVVSYWLFLAIALPPTSCQRILYQIRPDIRVPRNNAGIFPALSTVSSNKDVELEWSKASLLPETWAYVKPSGLDASRDTALKLYLYRGEDFVVVSRLLLLLYNITHGSTTTAVRAFPGKLSFGRQCHSTRL